MNYFLLAWYDTWTNAEAIGPYENRWLALVASKDLPRGMEWQVIPNNRLSSEMPIKLFHPDEYDWKNDHAEHDDEDV
jgi:hypothetical protein